jgi:hypothetical protein
MSNGLLRQVGVMPHKYLKGMYNLTDTGIPSMTPTPLEEALSTEYSTDAHFVTYRPLKTRDPYPRCNKTVLGQIRNREEDLVTDMMVFDWDLPGHRAWNPREPEAWMDAFKALGQDIPWVSKWTYSYFTEHGVRIIYLLDQTIPVDQAEGHHKWMVKELFRHKLVLDHKCSDWTRVFRLPQVLRDGKNTWEQPYFNGEYQPDSILALKDLGSEKSSTSNYVNVVIPDLPKPSIEEAHAILAKPEDPTKRAPWVERARLSLRNKPVYPVLFDWVPLAEEGERDDTIVRFVGQVVRSIYRLKDCGPEKVYALFLDPVLQLEGDDQTPDWTDVLWSAVLRIWAKETASYEARKLAVKQEMALGSESLPEIAENMKKWCDHPELDSHEAVDWVSRHLIANTGESFFVMKKDGYYDAMPTAYRQLIPRIKALGMSGAIQLQAPNATGTGLVPVSLLDILSNHSSPVGDIEAVPCLDGGMIRNIDRPDATLVLPSFRRNAFLVPHFDTTVDEWLRCLFAEHYDKAIQWIAWALAFEEGPICALSLAGPPGAGKKLFAQGLAETLEKPALASSADLVGQYQYGLRRSPFLLINEGWPRSANGMHPADKFRELTSGDPIMAVEKFRHPVSIKNPVRILFTANNMDVIKVLTANRELSPDDRQALAQRLFHIEYDRRAPEFLRNIGGIEYTGRLGQRWIAPDGGVESDYILAKHFLWLYEHRRALGPCGKRFLVEGEYNEELMFDMQTQSGSAPLIIETIINMIASGASRPGLVIRHRTGQIFILAADILTAHRAASNGKEQFSMAMVLNTLKSVSCSKTTRGGMVLSDREVMGRRRWHELDLHILLDVTKRDGWKCDILQILLNNREKLKGK